MKKLYNLILLSLVCFATKAQIVDITANPGYSGNIVAGQSNYHVSESIYLDSEIGTGVFTTAGNGITKIAFSVNSNSVATFPLTVSNYTISMKSTTATTLATGANNTTGYTVVYTGSITFNGIGWNTVLLSAPFVRTPGQNLQVKIQRSDNTANSGLVFDASVGNTPNSAATSSRRYNNTTAISGTTSMTATVYRPAIRLIRPFAVDAEVLGFINPYSSCYSSTQTVKVAIKNNGTSTIAAGAASVALDVATANTYTGSVSNTAPIPTDSIAILTFVGINLNNVGTNDETAIVTVAGDGYHANDSGFSVVTTTPVLSPLPQVEDVEGAFNVFAYLKSVAGSQAWTVLSFISNTGAFQNGYTQNDSLTPRPNGTGSDFFIFDSWDQGAGTVSRLYSNCISMPASGTSRVSFWMSHDSAFANNLDSLYVIVSNDKGASWTRVGGFQRSDASLSVYTWLQDSVDISAYNGQTIQVGFEGVSAYGNAFGLDDINIYNIVACSTFVTPTFTQVAPVCAGGTITLPAVSNNSVTGTWTPAINNQATTTYTFVPNGGQCVASTPVTMTVTVNPATVPTFTQVAAICRNGSFSLPTTSNNAISGTWAPAVNNQTTTTYTFTPAAGVCATTATMTVTVNQPATPTFTQVAAVCAGGSITLPATSNNAISGAWSPAVNNQATTTYIFTPTSGQCAGTATMTVTVKQASSSNSNASVCVSQLPYSWNGLSLSASGTYTKVFTGGNAAGCDSTAILNLTVNTSPVTPTFTQVAAICAGGSFTLPTTSIEGVNGTWAPAVNNQATTTYTFTPATGSCATSTTMTVTVNPNTVPTFTQVAAICAGGSFNLPTTSTNGVTGTWSPAVNNQATTTYTFTPAAGVCATTATMTVTVKQSTTSNTSANVCATSLPYIWNGISCAAAGSYTKVFAAGNSVGCDSTAYLSLTVNTTPSTPAFTQVAAICVGGSFTLPTTSNNGISGSWAPSVNNQATTTYTFTPNAGQCVSSTVVTMTVTVNQPVTPNFNQIATVCYGANINLPNTSNNGITGTWSPAINNQATTTYTFTPATGSCATTTTMTVTVTPQSPAPTGLQCYQTATWNPATCQWDVTGTQPVQPTTACYQTATFNTTTCSWVLTGTQPVQPSTECYQTATFNNTTCSWDVSGTQPVQPSTECYQTATFNTTSCSWVVTGTQPTRPTLACNETALFNNDSCKWIITASTTPCATTDAVIYPNPTDGNEYVTINYGNANFQANSKVIISVYDRTGKLVSKSPVKVVPSDRIDTKVDLGLKAYSNGLYIIKIETTIGQSARYSTKIIKAAKN